MVWELQVTVLTGHSKCGNKTCTGDVPVLLPSDPVVSRLSWKDPAMEISMQKVY